MPETSEKKKFLTKPLLLIFVTVMIDLIGFGIVIPVLPYYSERPEFGATPLLLGMLVASYSVMQFIFSPIFGSLSDRFGRRPVLFFSLLGTSAGFFIVGFAGSLSMLFAGRILDGITGGNISTAQAYIADVTTKKDRARGMGLIGAAFGIGFVLGPMLGGLLSRFGASVPFIFAGALAFANAIGVFIYLPESLSKEKRVVHASGPNRFVQMLDSLAEPRFRSLTIIYFLVVTGFTIMTTAFVLYTQERFGYDAWQNGWLFGYIGVIAVLMQGGLFARLAHAVGEAALLAVGSFILAASLVMVPYIGPQWGGLAGLLVGMAFFAVGNSLANPSVSSLASKVAKDHEQGKAMGIMQSGASLARAVGPVIAGLLLNTAAGTVNDHSLAVTFWTAAGIMFAGFIGALFFARNAPQPESAAA